MRHAFLCLCSILNHRWNIKPLVYTLANPGCKSRKCSPVIASPYLCAKEATTCEELNLKDGVSALQSVVPFLLKVPPHGGLEESAEVAWTCMEHVLGCFVDPDLCTYPSML